jgi:prepilin-type N-terminal cleavage/methylation domain-containing protein
MRSRSCRAFTLVELLVVIAIIGVLVALLLPAVQSAREAARRTQCLNNIKQLALAVHNFHDTNLRFPANGSKFTQGSGTCCTDKSWSWIARSLPYFEQNPLFMEAGIDDKSMTGNPSIAKNIKTLFCPSDVALLATNSPSTTRSDAQLWGNAPTALTNYKGVTGANWCWGNWPFVGTNGNCDCFYQNGTGLGDGVFFRTDILFRQRMAEVTDGTSNTLMIGEDVPYFSAWAGWAYANHAVGTCAIPPNVNLDKKFGIAPTWNWENTYSFRSRHASGLQFGLVDGSVRFLRDNIDLDVYRAASTTQGGEVTRID